MMDVRIIARRLLAVVFALAAPMFGPGAASAAGPRVVDLEGAPKGSATYWLETSLRWVFPNSKPGSSELSVLAPRNGRVAFQVAVRNDNSAMLFSDVRVVGADDLKPQVRFVGLVPVHHPTPGIFPQHRPANPIPHPCHAWRVHLCHQ